MESLKAAGTQRFRMQTTCSVSGISRDPRDIISPSALKALAFRIHLAVNETSWRSGKTTRLVSEIRLLSFGVIYFHRLLTQPLKFPHFQVRQDFFFFFAEKCRSVSSGQCQVFSPSVLTPETVVPKAPVHYIAYPESTVSGRHPLPGRPSRARLRCLRGTL